ncbi:MBL fold metallo-hydrolase [Plantactinospora sp. KLBMP9567]|uniref:MBL fold metallo-hydrolase n=1 Tax=Plantactinospora sp. KLBMP9567 TaxID=3085900 RepID=UPI002982AC61|nr:MBL fold metallo-hydrolase [Plantactinospora sp. KLBMP9567]MDW5329935.1 MBL fold metallo-hydrolase [Plantactinospora sp. KLBMP9567]
MIVDNDLNYSVFVSDPIPLKVPEPVPDGSRRVFSPLSTVLVHGEKDAVLVDPPLTVDQAQAVGDWVEASGKNLTHIFATHGHGDHWFTASLLADRFGARVVATADAIEQMHRNVALREVYWDKILPGQIPAVPITAEVAKGGFLPLERHELAIIEVGHSDTDGTAVLHVPHLSLVAAGDALYNGVHQYLAESANGGRDAWRKAIDTVEDLNAHRIVTGHKNKDLDDDATRIITETRQYLDDVDELLPECESAIEFFHAMVERHPHRLNPGALWSGALALYR